MGVPILDNDNVIPKCSANINSSKSRLPKDFIGNCKEFRIDCNRNNLRIIGNGNKIRINRNSGNLDIVGNDTRVKIMNNSGVIKYTGNSGRIYLGSDSSEQAVDYIGCNGILKVLNSADIRIHGTEKTDLPEKPKSSPKTTKYFTSSKNNETESGRKSNSLPSFSRFSIRNNISLPDIAHSSCHKNSASINNCINLSYSTGNIIIKNAISVSI